MNNLISESLMVLSAQIRQQEPILSAILLGVALSHNAGKSRELLDFIDPYVALAVLPANDRIENMKKQLMN